MALLCVPQQGWVAADRSKALGCLPNSCQAGSGAPVLLVAGCEAVTPRCAELQASSEQRAAHAMASAPAGVERLVRAAQQPSDIDSYENDPVYFSFKPKASKPAQRGRAKLAAPP